MSATKKGLDPLVECSEAQDSPDLNDVSTSKSVEAVTLAKNKNKRRRAGSRLSLSSLFSFSSQGREREGNRERSRSGWSCEEEPSEGMSSISATDLRSTGSCSYSIRRGRGSDAGSCADASRDCESCEMLLAETEVDDAPGSSKKKSGKTRECPLCCMRQPMVNFPKLLGCSHRSCRLCLMQYVEMEIMENRVEVSCPECPSHLHPCDIKLLVGGREGLIEKYEKFSMRRYLLSEPDARWCPAPDCGFAVIASSCAACPQLTCLKESCGTAFCYHCQMYWHTNQTCDEARRTRSAAAARLAASAATDGSTTAPIPRRMTNVSNESRNLKRKQIKAEQSTIKPGDMKACPRCHTLIVKMDDGSCNHMVCLMCSAEFCWLCLKEISDLHYLSPTGCTFWGKRPWTRKKKLLWQVGTLIGAPVGIALIAGLSVPGIIFGVPVFVGRKVHQRYLHQSAAKRRTVTAACVAGSMIVSPVLAVMAVGVGVPIMLAYVYGVVPLSLCRSGGCGLSHTGEDDTLEEEEMWREASGLERSQLLQEADRHNDSNSLAPALSIQSSTASTNHTRLVVRNFAKRARSPSMSSGSGRNSPDGRFNYEEASTKAMAGSQYHFYDDKSVNTTCSGHEVVSYSEDVASTKALSGSVHDSKSLTESYSGKHHKHDHDESHVFACSTLSNSSVEYTKLQIIDDANGQSVRKLRKEPRLRATVKVAAHVHPVPAGHADESLAEGDNASILEEGPSTSKAGPSTSSGIYRDSPASSSLQHQDEPDPYKIRALLDNMKQMVAADVPQERPYEPARATTSRIRRSGSGKSLATLGTTYSGGAAESQIKSEPVSTVRASKRGFFSGLFRRSKK